MATINCTNRIASPAFPGQSVWVTLNQAESISVMPVLAEGQLATNNGNSTTGYIDRIDTYGHKFRVKPIAYNKQFNSGSGAAGINTLNALELITVTY
jgi:hypothetical protein